jgi:hypothetical protein
MVCPTHLSESGGLLKDRAFCVTAKANNTGIPSSSAMLRGLWTIRKLSRAISLRTDWPWPPATSQLSMSGGQVTSRKTTNRFLLGRTSFEWVTASRATGFQRCSRSSFGHNKPKIGSLSSSSHTGSDEKVHRNLFAKNNAHNQLSPFSSRRPHDLQLDLTFMKRH